MLSVQIAIKVKGIVKHLKIVTLAIKKWMSTKAY